MDETRYFIRIPQQVEEKHRLDGLLNGLESYYDLATETVILVKSKIESLDPILSRLSIHVERPDTEPDPVIEQVKKKNRSNGNHSKSADGRKNPRIYTLEDGQKISKSEMVGRLFGGEIEPGTKVEHVRMGPMVVVEDGAGNLALMKEESR